MTSTSPRNAKTKGWLADLSGMMLAGSRADFGGLIPEEVRKSGKLIKFSGAKSE